MEGFLGIGGTELAIILLFAFLIFGPDKLPDIARVIGKGIAKFRDAQNEVNEVIRQEVFDPNDPDGKKKAAREQHAAEMKAKYQDKGTESFTDRKARYDQIRAERKAKEEEARAEREAREAEAKDTPEGDTPSSPATHDSKASAAETPAAQDGAAPEAAAQDGAAPEIATPEAPAVKDGAVANPEEPAAPKPEEPATPNPETPKSEAATPATPEAAASEGGEA